MVLPGEMSKLSDLIKEEHLPSLANLHQSKESLKSGFVFFMYK